jgi:hypothetical protein
MDASFPDKPSIAALPFQKKERQSRSMPLRHEEVMLVWELCGQRSIPWRVRFSSLPNRDISYNLKCISHIQESSSFYLSP